MQEPRRVRFLYQGILQVGVRFYHQQNGNWRGATGLLRNGIRRLKEFEPETLGVDVARLVRECERCLESSKNWDPSGTRVPSVLLLLGAFHIGLLEYASAATKLSI